MKKGIKLSVRSRVKLTDEEIEELKTFCDNSSNAPWATIYNNINVKKETIEGMINSGGGELRVVMKVRDFLKGLKELETANPI